MSNSHMSRTVRRLACAWRSTSRSEERGAVHARPLASRRAAPPPGPHPEDELGPGGARPGGVCDRGRWRTTHTVVAETCVWTISVGGSSGSYGPPTIGTEAGRNLPATPPWSRKGQGVSCTTGQLNRDREAGIVARPHPTLDRCSSANARNIPRTGGLGRTGAGGAPKRGLGGPGFWCRPAVIRPGSAPGREGA
jgi:hypothetical protein